jgi:inner membrane protein YidH
MTTRANPAFHAESASTELSARRTGMSFQRTRMSADRTLMSVIRTSLSLIGFGFTIFQFFRQLREAGTLKTAAGAPRNFGVTLVVLGVCLLVVGILYQVRFMAGLRKLREDMKAQGLIHGESGFPVSYTMVVAVLLLLFGVTAFVSMTLDVGPFS